MLVRGAGTGWYPYPFLDHREHGWDHVAIVCAGIFVLFFALVFGEPCASADGAAPAQRRPSLVADEAHRRA